MNPTMALIDAVLLTLTYSSLALGLNSEGYLINTKKCKIPDLAPFNEEVRELTKQWNYITCNRSELLTYTTKKDNIVTLHLKKELTVNFTPGPFGCCYANVSRDTLLEYPDTGIQISECRQFEEEVTLTHHPVMVKCLWQDRVVYENVHNPLVVQDAVKNKQRGGGNQLLSVLFVVIDSISRLNFMRTMPKTRSFLLRSNFIEMKGYNKIGLNTFPNFMALLTGFNLTQSLHQCNPNKLNKLDECPMIWYDYRDLGYVTAYVEDFDSINTFTYDKKKGFNNPPTDYYFKSYMAAAEQLGVLELFGMPYCTGPETSAERVLNLARDFLDTFKEYPTFGVFWMNTFSHNELNCPTTMDEKVEQFFQDMQRRGVLNDSVVILLSDHGLRFGDILSTRSGWFEERLPVNFISVPEWFKTKFVLEYDHLRKNSHKLTNTYDMYMTLQHILLLSKVPYQNRTSTACSNCRSLFEEIPDRSCEEAAIAPEWCTCV